MNINKYCGAAVLIALASFIFLFSSCEQIFTYSPVSWAVRENNPSYKLAKAIDDLGFSLSNIEDIDFSDPGTLDLMSAVVDAVKAADGKTQVTQDQYLLAAAFIVIIEVEDGDLGFTDMDDAKAAIETAEPNKDGTTIEQALYYAEKGGISKSEILEIMDLF